MKTKHSQEPSDEEDTDNEAGQESMDESSDEDEVCVDVWGVIKTGAVANGGDILESYKCSALFCRSMDNDETHTKVMQTLESAQDNDGIKFQEALDYAVNKRTFLILKHTQKLDYDEENEQSAM